MLQIQSLGALYLVCLLQHLFLFFQEGRTIVENKTADIIQETRKLQIMRKGSGPDAQNQASGANSSWQQPLIQPVQPQNQMNHENQLKASRDVRWQLCNCGSLVHVAKF